MVIPRGRLRASTLVVIVSQGVSRRHWVVIGHWARVLESLPTPGNRMFCSMQDVGARVQMEERGESDLGTRAEGRVTRGQS